MEWVIILNPETANFQRAAHIEQFGRVHHAGFERSGDRERLEDGSEFVDRPGRTIET